MNERSVIALLLVLELALGTGCVGPMPLQQGPEPYKTYSPYGPRRRLTQMTGHFGARTLNDASWQPLENQIVFGLSLAEPIQGPIWLEGGTQWSYDSATVQIGGNDESVRADIFDFYLGLLLQPWFRGYRFRPYGGIGFNFRDIDYENELMGVHVRESELVLGGYGRLGIRFEIYPGAFIGLEVRAFEGETVRLNGADLETDSLDVVFVSGTGI